MQMLLSPNIHKSTIWSFKAQSMKAAVFILRPVMLYKDQTMLSHSVHFLQRSMKSAQSFSITSQHNKAKCVYGKNLSKIIKMKDYISQSKLVTIWIFISRKVKDPNQMMGRILFWRIRKMCKKKYLPSNEESPVTCVRERLAGSN